MAIIAISGVSAVVVFSGDVHSEISPVFVQAHFPQKTHKFEFTSSVSVSLGSQSLSSFTCVIDFIVHERRDCWDGILGIDWYQECERSGMLHLVESVVHADSIIGEFFFFSSFILISHFFS